MARVSPPDRLMQFLARYKCTPEEKENKLLTHTWFGECITTYNIPSEKYAELYDLLYTRVFVEKKPAHLIERFTNPSILKIDFDFEFAYDSRTRMYTSQHIQDIVKIYNKIIQEYIDIPIEKINAYIFERPKGYRTQGKYKDGIHIMYPEVVISIELQKFVRQKFMETGLKILERLELKNKNYDLVVDDSIIDRNGWMMYGCTKVAIDPYLLTTIYNFSMEQQQLPTDNRALIEFLSVYNCDDKVVSMIRDDKKSELDKYKKPMNNNNNSDKSNRTANPHKVRIPMGQRRPHTTRTNDDIEMVIKLVKLLSDYRAYEHKQWIEVGLCLFNIDDSLLDTWIEFSQRVADKFVPGECEEKWMTFKHKADDAVLGLGSLHRWAMLDDPVGYEIVKRGSISSYIEQSMNGATYTIAKVVYEMYKYQYVCTSLRHNTWYEFKNHKWHEIEAGIDLKNKLSNDVLNEYLRMNQNFLSRGIEMNGANKQPYIDNAKKLLEVTLKLQDITFKDKLMKECSAMFYESKFVNKLDINPDLICFENGVYNLISMEFRDGRPEDYCSISTGNDYIVFADDAEEIVEVKDFMSKVFPKEDVKEYTWTLFASFLQGKNPDEKFHVLTGTGSNGKSKLIELFKKAFGDYTGSLPISLLTQKRSASSAASPELARCRGLRFVDMAEPGRGERMNIGLMKQLTGGDMIMARPLYKEPFDFKPMFKIALCCNDLPKVPPDDEGTWRRLRVLKFIAKFTSKPKKEFEFMIDPYLAEKFDRWKEAFMYILLQYYEKYRKEGIFEPDDVQQATIDYQKTADIYVDFLDENTTKAETNVGVFVEDLYLRFRTWYSQNYGGHCDNLKKFKILMEKKLGPYLPSHGWLNLKYKFGEPISKKDIPKEIDSDDDIDENNDDDTKQTELKKKFSMKIASRQPSRQPSRQVSRKTSRQINKIRIKDLPKQTDTNNKNIDSKDTNNKDTDNKDIDNKDTNNKDTDDKQKISESDVEKIKEIAKIMETDIIEQNEYDNKPVEIKKETTVMTEVRKLKLPLKNKPITV